MPAATRRAAGPLATRYKYLTARNTALARSAVTRVALGVKSAAGAFLLRANSY